MDTYNHHFTYNNIPLVVVLAFKDSGTQIFDIVREDTDKFVDSLSVHPFEGVQRAAETWKANAAQYINW